jgi:TPR repeat protein
MTLAGDPSDRLEQATAARAAGRHAEALEHYLAAASQDSASAQSWAAWFYSQGLGTEQDPGQAFRLWRAAAEQGDATGEANLGVCYMYADGVEQNYEEGVRWLFRGAEQGQALAQCELGIAYAFGRGVPQDDVEAVKWYRLAAEQGRATAQSDLGYFHALGRGVAQDDVEALRWFRLAAAQGHLTANNWVASYYASGKGGVRQDHAEAARLYRISAEKGEAHAQGKLGALYAQGLGLPKDLAQAAYWLKGGAGQGDPDARDWLAKLSEQRVEVATYSPTRVFISGLIAAARALVMVLATFLGAVWLFGSTDFSREHSIFLRLLLSPLLLIPVAIGLHSFWSAFARLSQAFAYHGHLRAGPGGIDIDLPDVGQHSIARESITGIVQYTYRVNGVRSLNALKIRLSDGREIMIENSFFKESVSTIQQRLLDILKL